MPGHNGYLIPALYTTFFPIPDPTQFSFENHRATRNIGYSPVFRVETITSARSTDIAAEVVIVSVVINLCSAVQHL